jgi:predicted nucleotidyltransferase
MVDESIVGAVQNYLRKCREQGLDVRFGVIFGSQVEGTPHEWSDIDLVVVSPAFDAVRREAMINLLWHTTAYTDNRIEPIACGEWQWEHDDVSAIIEVARREGVRVEVAAETLVAKT